MKDTKGRPVVVVTGMGVVTSLGQGKQETWAALTAGKSGIRQITRFPTAGLKTTIAGTVDFVKAEPFCAAQLSENFARLAVEEAVSEAKIGTKGTFPGPMFIAVPPVEMEWPQREALAKASGATDNVTYADLLRAADTGQFKAWHNLFLFGTVADRLADEFGTQGSPISLSTACSSGATAIQLGVEAIRRGETDAALCIGTDGSVQAEALIRFSLLSALSTQNDPPEGASKPFSKNRDGFVMGEGAAALVLESYASAKARGATILGVIAGCGEKGDGFHRTRTSPDGMPAILAMRGAIEDAGLTPDDIDYVNAHGTSTPENDKMESLRLHDRDGRADEIRADLVQQVDDRPHADRCRRGGGGDEPDDAATPAHPADHQLHPARSGHSARCGAECSARRQPAPCDVQFLRLRRPEYGACLRP
jgi:3-oxoacyl-[acyl-carrier-protein] synthase II